MSSSGVPAFLDMAQFVCETCTGTRDQVCASCAKFDIAVQKVPKLAESAATLGKYIDAYAYKKGFLDQ